MERKYETLIKEEHKLGKNKYVQGRVSGYKEMICDGKRNGIEEPGLANGEIPGVGLVLVTICEAEQYARFSDHVEKMYPGLCVFNYKEESDCGEEP